MSNKCDIGIYSYYKSFKENKTFQLGKEHEQGRHSTKEQLHEANELIFENSQNAN